MFSLSDDKSTYGTLKALVMRLKEDVYTVEQKRRHYSERSRDYANATGEMAGYNLTIATIMSTDAWHKGQQEEAKLPAVPHMHTRSMATNESRVLRNNEELNVWLGENVYEGASLWVALTQNGLSVVHCNKRECLQ